MHKINENKMDQETKYLSDCLDKCVELFKSGKLIGDKHRLTDMLKIDMMNVHKDWYSPNDDDSVEPYRITVDFKNLVKFDINLKHYKYSDEFEKAKMQESLVNAFQKQIDNIIELRRTNSRNIFNI